VILYVRERNRRFRFPARSSGEPARCGDTAKQEADPCGYVERSANHLGHRESEQVEETVAFWFGRQTWQSIHTGKWHVLGTESIAPAGS